MASVPRLKPCAGRSRRADCSGSPSEENSVQMIPSRVFQNGTSLFQGLVECARKIVRGSADDIGWLQRDQSLAPTEDGTARFLEILDSVRLVCYYFDCEYAAAMRKTGDAQARELLERVSECLDKERSDTFEDCITWARLKFEDYFSNRVKQLAFTFPKDAANSTGGPFWSAQKCFPHPLKFSAADPSHIHFIMSVSILRAESFGIAIPDWAKKPQVSWLM